MEATHKGILITYNSNEELNTCITAIDSLYRNDYERYEVITTMQVNEFGGVVYTTCLHEDENQLITL